jgi:hypothetical protein
VCWEADAAVRIAVLGWGSLIWNPRELRLASHWQPDGPFLPIEFARISATGPPRLTLAIRQDADKVRTLWAQSAHDKLDGAMENLATRENTTSEKIGYVRRGDQPLESRSRLTSIIGAHLKATPEAPTTGDLLQHIDWWRSEHQVDAVIWTDLPSNFEESFRNDGQPAALSGETAVSYLESLRDAAFAEEYVRRAPPQIRTRIRRHLEKELGWLPSPTSMIGPGDPRFDKEWAECRTTIGRLDNVLVDLRKLGFSFITALLTAGAVLSFLGIQTVANVDVPPIPTRAAPFISIVVLIVALFFLDSYYEVLLSAAVERALDIETLTDPAIRLTKYIGINAGRSRASNITLGLYLFLLLAACGLAVLAATTKTSVIGGVTSVSFEWNLIGFGIVGLGVFIALVMFLYWLYLGVTTGVHTRKAGRPWRAGESARDKIAAP